MQESADDQPLKKKFRTSAAVTARVRKSRNRFARKKAFSYHRSESTGEKTGRYLRSRRRELAHILQGNQAGPKSFRAGNSAGAKDSKTKAPFKTTKLTDWIQPKKSTSSSTRSRPKTKPISNLNRHSTRLARGVESQAKRSVHPRKEEPPLDAEESGPLAGIEGTLQGEELSYLYTRPQTYSSSLTVTESQENRLQVLKNIADQARWEDEASLRNLFHVLGFFGWS